jgi:uncharacterized protein (DUF2235 family)
MIKQIQNLPVVHLAAIADITEKRLVLFAKETNTTLTAQAPAGWIIAGDHPDDYVICFDPSIENLGNTNSTIVSKLYAAYLEQQM